MDKYKILLVDDHKIVLDGLTAILEDEQVYEIVALAKNGKEAIQLAEALQPDLVMLDIDMPVMNGLVASKEIKERFPSMKVIILSLHQEGGIIRKLIKIGIDGYLLKSADSKEMLMAIESVRNGRPYFSGEVTLLLSQSKPHTISEDGAMKMSSLTERELEILKAIAEGFSSREIGERLHISARTVDTHRTNMMKKLGVTKVVGLLRWAIKWGLVD